VLDPLTRLLHRGAGRHGPVMLMYHAISPGRKTPNWPWAVSMQAFRDQLDFLATAGYATPTLRELLSMPPSARTGRIAVITFDDGYADNLAAVDELQTRGMRASWFITSDSIGGTPQWADAGRPPCRMLDRQELRTLHAAGMEIGSHTASHARLTALDDAGRADELGRSRAVLEDLLGETVGSFAYPYGLWDAQCVEAVRQAGYSAACTTRTGWMLRDDNPYTLRRLTVYNTDSLGVFVRNLSLADNQTSFSRVLQYKLAHLNRRFKR
jgi:peptidoglycan/xylan/chitin deacetylase (PgdA/CDA1 family)